MNPDTPISKIMTTKLTLVNEDTPISEIAAIFNKNKFHHLPVVADASRLMGIITREDLLSAEKTLAKESSGKVWVKKKYEHLTAKDIMTASPLCLESEDTIGLAADVFLENKFHALPIVEDGAIVGIITTHDLIAFAFESPIENTASTTIF